jgi:hypothetical protein
MKRYLKSVTAVFVLVLAVSVGTVSAANTPDLTQTINAGTLATDILDNTGAVVGSPSAALSTRTFSFGCQSGGSASTGTLGTNLQRLYVMNPDSADNGWTLTIAATGGATSVWENAGATQTFDFNDPTTSGCTDGGDVDTRGGQLTINPAAGSLTTDCISCTTGSITLGSSSAYSQGVTDSITLINAAAGSNDVWRGYLTNVGLSQTIPAEQAVDSYDINLTITVTAS